MCDDLPPLWHELYLKAPRPTSELGSDGHPRNSALVPPLDDRRRMFGGGRITVHQPLRLGESAQRTSSVADFTVKQGRTGWLLLLTELHEYRVDGVERVREERDIVYRMPLDVGRAARPSDRAPEPESAVEEPVLELVVDERLLFCFSALTYNAHRIHYDHRYAVEVEGRYKVKAQVKAGFVGHHGPGSAV